MTDSNSEQQTQSESNINNFDRRVGIEGSDNLVQGEGSGFQYSPVDQSLRAGASISGDENFAPSFVFSGNDSGAGLTLAKTTAALQKNPSIKADLQEMLAASGDTRSPEQWLLDDLNAGDTNSEFLQAVNEGAPVGRDSAAAASTQIGGAVQGAGFVAGQVSAPVASGADSVAMQFGTGQGAGGDIIDSISVAAPNSGAVIRGDVINSPVISAPIAGPAIITGGDVVAPVVNANAGGNGVSAPITSGGDLEVNAPVITGNQGTVTITTADADVARAAIESAGSTLSTSLDFADKALAKVSESQRDPGEKVTSAALNTVLYAALGLGALVLLSK